MWAPLRDAGVLSSLSLPAAARRAERVGTPADGVARYTAVLPHLA